MTIIGGKNYRWKGKNIRTINYQDVPCVTMPRKDSSIITPANINTGSFYKVTITACNKGGNGKILLLIDDIVVEGIYIVSSDFKEYNIDMHTDSIFNPTQNLVVSRTNV